MQKGQKFFVVSAKGVTERKVGTKRIRFHKAKISQIKRLPINIVTM